MASKQNILVTGTGGIAKAIVRALVPVGYHVRTVGIEPQGVTVFEKLFPERDAYPQLVLNVLQGKDGYVISPFTPLESRCIPHTSYDLSNTPLPSTLFQGIDVAILTAANPNSDQSAESAYRNQRIDRQTIDAALDAGAKGIIYTSSVWRTMDSVFAHHRGDTLVNPNVLRTPPANVPYAQAKAQSVDYLYAAAQRHPETFFAFIDMGWFPRETLGPPISNVKDRHLQWWLAESELQQLYLTLTERALNHASHRTPNILGFNGVSKNEPFPNLNHCEFPYDLSDSAAIGVKQTWNVYNVLAQQTSAWRKIPIPSK